MNYDEFLDKYEDKLEQGIVENGCIGDFFDMVLEMASSTKREIDSRLRKLYSHMLKYQFQMLFYFSYQLKLRKNKK